MAADRYELCIIGAGIAGALLAVTAARQGRKVLLVEAGNRFPLEGRRQLLRRYDTLGGLYVPWQHPGRDRYVDSSGQSIGYPYELERYRAKGVGGSTLHWGGRAQRLMPSDFRTASTYGLGTDWPLSYDELEPYYCAAEWEIGVSGSPHTLQAPRSRDFPMPGFPFSPDERMWLPIAQKMDIELYSAPFAINSMPYAGRTSCKAYSACNICPSGARYCADIHVAEAEKTGNCVLLTETVARRIDLNASGTVTRIHATTLDGRDLEVQADRYVIAAHGVESARLLLLSKCGNHSDQVGRNFMEHPFIKAAGYVPTRQFYPDVVGFERLESMSFYEGKDRQKRGAFKLEFEFSYDPLRDMEFDHLWGDALARHDQKLFGHWLGINVETEMQGNADSRVTLDSKAKDMFGDPVPHLRIAFCDTDIRTQRRALQVATELLQAAGAQDIRPIGPNGLSFPAHHMGTCRMSKDPDAGVVDRDCRVHGTSNLYVVGSSVYPTGGGCNPTLTIAALSLRLADHLLQSNAS
ncbi:MAG TPA: GMC family oxidoreductase [Steroidobacteraceae bacterium]|nr:GMC family oxidoreductase [Steroidobacteraceae bacterium]